LNRDKSFARRDESRAIPMKLGVISDTHVASFGIRKVASHLIQRVNVDEDELYKLLKPHFQGVKAVLHCGDIVDRSVLDMLENFGEVYAVAGNMDPYSIRAQIPEQRIVEFGKFKIGMIHGWGSPEGLSTRVRQKFAGEKLDCIVFGHSHQPYDRVEGGILMFNPGSATDRRFAPKRTIGILHLEDRIWGEHIDLA